MTKQEANYRLAGRCKKCKFSAYNDGIGVWCTKLTPERPDNSKVDVEHVCDLFEFKSGGAD